MKTLDKNVPKYINREETGRPAPYIYSHKKGFSINCESDAHPQQIGITIQDHMQMWGPLD